MAEEKAFRLGGEEYRLSKQDVEERMRKLVPKPLGKYRVEVNGIDYPPKQVVAESLRKELVTFTTMDATRILAALGFEVQGVGTRREPKKNESEILFEQYLAMSGLSEFEFERQFQGKSQRPDYVVKLADGIEILFEVKEFRTTMDDFRPGGGGAYDPYAYIREKIDQARDKFKGFKDFCCCLVLFNRDKPLVDLSWQMVYGAMLGNIGFRIPVNLTTGAVDDENTQQVFTTGGKMHRYQGLQPVGPQNQTISAILVLDLLPMGRIRFDAYIEQLESTRGSKVGVEEYTRLIEDSRGKDRDRTMMQRRGVVQENPHARFRLPQELFSGPYDERYGHRDGQIQRLYAGAGIEGLTPELIEKYR